MKKIIVGGIAVRRLLFVGTAIAALASPALATDLPPGASPVARAAPRPAVYIWNGAYFGGNIGYSWGNWDSTGFVAGGAVSPSVNGILGGLQLGYNWQSTNRWLLGLEADIQITGERKSIDWTTPAVCPPTAGPPFCVGGSPSNNSWSFPWFGTIRGRLGYAPDTWLLYFTGGAVVGRTKSSLTTTGLAVSESTTKWGWTIGGGAEYALSAKWSAKLEYLYLDLGSRIFFSSTAPVDTRLRDHVLRVGVNYKLN